jgi:hypothetical protein
MVDQAQAAVELAKAKAPAAGLGEPARTYMNYVNARDVARAADAPDHPRRGRSRLVSVRGLATDTLLVADAQ